MSMSLYSRLARRFGGPDRFTSQARRDALKATLAASAGLLLSGPAAFAGMARSAFGAKRVVVVGGGFAGLACAFELKAAGYDVTVVEARSRVGGRVVSFTDLVKGRVAEGGGELVGSNHPHWVNYAEKFGLDFLDVTENEEDEFPIVLGGKRLTADESGSLWEELDAAFNTMNDDARKVDADAPWNSPDAAALDAKNTAQWLAGLEVSDLCKKAIDAQLSGDNGVHISRQSYLGNLTSVKGGGVEAYWTDSEVYRCKGGNQQLASKLAADLADRVVTKLPVTEITAKGDAMAVVCADGRRIECDDVVLAVPPTVWGKVRIQPDAIAAIKPQMGVNVKWLAAVQARFWEGKKLSPTSLSDGPISWTWEGTDAQEGDGPATFHCFSGGPAAEKVRAWGPDERAAKYTEIISATYPEFAEQVMKDPRPRFMDWPGDAWTMAGYSFPAPGQVTTVGPALAKSYGRLHLAGEHCCYKFVGYMEGALTSGVSVAKRLAKRDGLISG